MKPEAIVEQPIDEASLDPSDPILNPSPEVPTPAGPNEGLNTVGVSAPSNYSEANTFVDDTGVKAAEAAVVFR